MDELSLVDYAILILFGVAAVTGLFTGLVAGVLRIGVTLAAVLCTFWYGPGVADWLGGVFPERWMSTVAGHLGMFFAVLVTGGLLIQLLRRAVEFAGLGGMDRVGGLLFGLAGAYLALVVVFYVLAHTPYKDSELSDESRFAHMFEEGGRWLSAHLGEQVEQVRPLLGEQVEQARPLLGETIEIPTELPGIGDLPVIDPGQVTE